MSSSSSNVSCLATSNLKIYAGSLTDPVFASSRTCIVVPCNSITLKNYGATRVVVEKYPYGDVAGLRQPIPGGSVSCYRDRQLPGQIIVKRPEPIEFPSAQLLDENSQRLLEKKIFENEEKPHICTIISQYCIGEAIDCNNSISTSMLNQEQFEVVKEQIQGDTRYNRVLYFNKSLTKLAKLIKTGKLDVENVVFPIGIGHGGCSLKTYWLKKYIPLINYFSKQVSVPTIISTPDHVFRKIMGSTKPDSEYYQFCKYFQVATIFKDNTIAGRLKRLEDENDEVDLEEIIRINEKEEKAEEEEEEVEEEVNRKVKKRRIEPQLEINLVSQEEEVETSDSDKLFICI